MTHPIDNRRGGLSRWVEYIGWRLIDLIFPPQCVGCGEWGTYWCEDCLTQIDTISPPLCGICGEPFVNLDDQYRCQRCRERRPFYTAMRSWAVFKGYVQNAIHQLKYRKNIGLGNVLANFLAKVYRQTAWQIDLVVPVPLGPKRKKERGYNQAQLIARPLAQMADLPCHPSALHRIRETRSQVGLTVQERRQNVAGAFQAQSEKASGKTVLVVDDVTTTGSTINACAAALKKVGAKDVYGLTLARALRKTGSS